MERKVRGENCFSLKQSLSFIAGLLLFCNMIQIYWIIKHEAFDEIIIRVILASILSALIGLSAFVLFRRTKNIKGYSSSAIIVFLSLFFWLMNIVIAISLMLGISYKPYLLVMALTSFCILSVKHRRYIIAFLIIISVGSPILWYISVIYKFNSIKIKTLNKLPRNMIWAHRGYMQGFPDNSIESFDAAKRMGYYGIELDLHFTEKGLIVAHDIPKEEIDHETYLLLEKVFDRYRDNFYYWLDFKNLDTNNATKSGSIKSEPVAEVSLSKNQL